MFDQSLSTLIDFGIIWLVEASPTHIPLSCVLYTDLLRGLRYC